MSKLLINDQNKALINNSNKAYAINNIDVLKNTSSSETFSATAGKILKLIRYGKCEHVGTPTPSTPTSIMCNNGTLQVVDDELPINYKRVTGIIFDGDTYYNTNKKLNGSDVVTMTISDFVSAGQNLFGCYSGTGSDVYNFSLYIYGSSTGQAYWRYGKTLYRPTVGSTDTRTITFGAGGTTGFKSNSTHSKVDFETTDVAWIGGLPNSSSPKFEGTILGDITIGERLKYVPCERVSDGVIGYYEVVNGEFLEPSGTAPTAGSYDYSHFMVLNIIGTPESITFFGSNLLNPATVPDENKFITRNNGSTAAPSATGGVFRHSEYIPIVGGKTYRLGCVPYTASTAGLAWYNSENTSGFISGMSGTSIQEDNMIVTAPTNATYVRFSWRVDEGYNVDWENSVYFCVNGELDRFFPYSQTASVADLFGVGDFKDEQDVISGVLTRKVGVKVLTGSESWTRTSSNRFTMALDEAVSGTGNTVVCSHFPYSASSVSTSCCRITNTGRLFICDMDLSEDATASDFKAFLASQLNAETPVIVLYPLATPIEERTTSQLLQTDTGQNTITDIAEVSNPEYKIIYKI